MYVCWPFAVSKPCASLRSEPLPQVGVVVQVGGVSNSFLQSLPHGMCSQHLRVLQIPISESQIVEEVKKLHTVGGWVMSMDRMGSVFLKLVFPKEQIVLY